jgi:hypothetical protein
MAAAAGTTTLAQVHAEIVALGKTSHLRLVPLLGACLDPAGHPRRHTTAGRHSHRLGVRRRRRHPARHCAVV